MSYEEQYQARKAQEKEIESKVMGLAMATIIVSALTAVSMVLLNNQARG